MNESEHECSSGLCISEEPGELGTIATLTVAMVPRHF